MKHRIIFVAVILFFAASCAKTERNYSNTTIKDLDECMIDLKAYQEAMGIHLKKGELENAEWLYEGTDSLLQLMGNTFKEHRKLQKTF